MNFYSEDSNLHKIIMIKYQAISMKKKLATLNNLKDINKTMNPLLNNLEAKMLNFNRNCRTHNKEQNKLRKIIKMKEW